MPNTSPNKIDELNIAWSRRVYSILHDINTPLASLTVAGHIMGEALPTLKKAYELAVKNGLMEDSLSRKIWNGLDATAGETKKTAEDLIAHLRNLRAETNLMLDPKARQKISIKDAIDHLLKDFAFENEAQKKLIEVQLQTDFTVHCASLFLEPLLYNVLENALRAIKNAGKGDVKIWTETKSGENILHIKDTGKGMSEDDLKIIFKNNFSHQKGKKILGLCPCRLGILLAGGDIVYTSEPGQYTEVQVKFPVEGK